MKLQKTITSIFIVPTLSINRDKLNDNGFINGYIKDGRREIQYDGCIYLLFQPKDLDKFRRFLDEEYERTKQVIDDYDYPNGYVVVVYKLNERLKEDFDLIKQSKYSQTSTKFQDIFPKKLKSKASGKDEVSLQYRIFNKTEDLREYWKDKLGTDIPDDVEFWQGFFEENEIINLDKLKQHV